MVQLLNINIMNLYLTALMTRHCFHKMNLPPSPSNVSPSSVFLPDELIVEVLSWLTVKQLMRLKYVSKSWKSLISEPTFVKFYLNHFAQNTDLTLVSHEWNEDNEAVSFTVLRLLEYPPIIINLPGDPYYQLDKDIIIGS
ncbi:putative F-box domain-containing protein [Medicago truncatula]|uniref:Putative F-box domain-containing protein n=1 Tax=Medicago truncatula TaxID=3880 RepID=A0A396GVV2_MEDTR|nr:putative F-box domain-containing protein [Medicago truncatula]